MKATAVATFAEHVYRGGSTGSRSSTGDFLKRIATIATDRRRK